MFGCCSVFLQIKVAYMSLVQINQNVKTSRFMNDFWLAKFFLNHLLKETVLLKIVRMNIKKLFI